MSFRVAKSTILPVFILVTHATLSVARGRGGSGGGGDGGSTVLGFAPGTPPALITMFAFDIIFGVITLVLFGRNFLSFKSDPINRRPRGPFAALAVVLFLNFSVCTMDAALIYGLAARDFSQRFDFPIRSGLGIALSFVSLAFIILLLASILLTIRAIRTHFANPGSTTTKLPSRLGRLMGIIVDSILLSLVALFGIVALGLRGYIQSDAATGVDENIIEALIRAYNGLLYTRIAFTLLASISVIVGIVLLRREIKCKPSKTLLIVVLPVLSLRTLYTLIDTIILATPAASNESSLAESIIVGLCNVVIMGALVSLGRKTINWKREGGIPAFGPGSPLKQSEFYSPTPSQPGSFYQHQQPYQQQQPYNPYPAPAAVPNHDVYNPYPQSQPQWSNSPQPYDANRQSATHPPIPSTASPAPNYQTSVPNLPQPYGQFETHNENQSHSNLAAENEVLRRRLAELEGRPVA